MKKIFRSALMLVVAAVFCLTGSGDLSAQSNALQITPRKDYTLKPGESVSDTLTVTNRNPEVPLNLKLSVIDFTSENETGAPLMLEAGAPKTAWSLIDYIEMPQQVVLGPGETVRIPINVTVPAGIGAGSYYSAIEYAAVNDFVEDRVNISASSITLMFVKVPGQARQQLDFVQFGAFKPAKSSSQGSFSGLFFNERPTVMAYRLKNEGNIAESPKSAIVIKDFSGKEVYTIEDANPKGQLALRGQTRRFETCIVTETVQQTTESGTEFNATVCGDTNFKPGRYTADLTILYGENGNPTEQITARATFWYLPWWFLALAALVLALISGTILYVVRRIKHYRDRKTRRR